MPSASFDGPQLKALCDLLVSGEGELSHEEVTTYLHNLGLPVPDQRRSRAKRLYETIAASQNMLGSSVKIFALIELAANPARFISGSRGAHEDYCARLNEVLSMIGTGLGPDGKTKAVRTATTVHEAQRRANELRESMKTRGCHPDVLKFCRPELMDQNFFHAVLEAVKSVSEKIRQKTGLDGDGEDLVSRTFGGSQPLWVINTFASETDRSEQKGFCKLVSGVFGMVRNPLAHEAKILRPMNRDDAEDIMSMLSYIHRRIDSMRMPPRA